MSEADDAHDNLGVAEEHNDAGISTEIGQAVLNDNSAAVSGGNATVDGDASKEADKELYMTAEHLEAEADASLPASESDKDNAGSAHENGNPIEAEALDPVGQDSEHPPPHNNVSSGDLSGDDVGVGDANASGSNELTNATDNGEKAVDPPASAPDFPAVEAKDYAEADGLSSTKPLEEAVREHLERTDRVDATTNDFVVEARIEDVEHPHVELQVSGLDEHMDSSAAEIDTHPSVHPDVELEAVEEEASDPVEHRDLVETGEPVAVGDVVVDGASTTFRETSLSSEDPPAPTVNSILTAQHDPGVAEDTRKESDAVPPPLVDELTEDASAHDQAEPDVQVTVEMPARVGDEPLAQDSNEVFTGVGDLDSAHVPPVHGTSTTEVIPSTEVVPEPLQEVDVEAPVNPDEAATDGTVSDTFSLLEAITDAEPRPFQKVPSTSTEQYAESASAKPVNDTTGAPVEDGNGTLEENVTPIEETDTIFKSVHEAGPVPALAVEDVTEDAHVSTEDGPVAEPVPTSVLEGATEPLATQELVPPPVEVSAEGTSVEISEEPTTPQGLKDVPEVADVEPNAEEAQEVESPAVVEEAAEDVHVSTEDIPVAEPVPASILEATTEPLSTQETIPPSVEVSAEATGAENSVELLTPEALKDEVAHVVPKADETQEVEPPAVVEEAPEDVHAPTDDIPVAEPIVASILEATTEPPSTQEAIPPSVEVSAEATDVEISVEPITPEGLKNIPEVADVEPNAEEAQEVESPAVVEEATEDVHVSTDDIPVAEPINASILEATTEPPSTQEAIPPSVEVSAEATDVEISVEPITPEASKDEVAHIEEAQEVQPPVAVEEATEDMHVSTEDVPVAEPVLASILEATTEPLSTQETVPPSVEAVAGVARVGTDMTPIEPDVGEPDVEEDATAAAAGEPKAEEVAPGSIATDPAVMDVPLVSSKEVAAEPAPQLETDNTDDDIAPVQQLMEHSVPALAVVADETSAGYSSPHPNQTDAVLTGVVTTTNVIPIAHVAPVESLTETPAVWSDPLLKPTELTAADDHANKAGGLSADIPAIASTSPLDLATSDHATEAPSISEVDVTSVDNTTTSEEETVPTVEEFHPDAAHLPAPEPEATESVSAPISNEFVISDEDAPRGNIQTDEATSQVVHAEHVIPDDHVPETATDAYASVSDLIATIGLVAAASATVLQENVSSDETTHEVDAPATSNLHPDSPSTAIDEEDVPIHVHETESFVSEYEYPVVDVTPPTASTVPETEPHVDAQSGLDALDNLDKLGATEAPVDAAGPEVNDLTANSSDALEEAPVEIAPNSQLTPSSSEVEQPKSPWTPSYSVTSQGPAIASQEDIDELELPPNADGTAIKEELKLEESPQVVEATQENEILQDATLHIAEALTIETASLSIPTEENVAERPKSPWTPSYSVTHQGVVSDVEELDTLPPQITAPTETAADAAIPVQISLSEDPKHAARVVELNVPQETAPEPEHRSDGEAPAQAIAVGGIGNETVTAQLVSEGPVFTMKDPSEEPPSEESTATATQMTALHHEISDASIEAPESPVEIPEYKDESEVLPIDSLVEPPVEPISEPSERHDTLSLPEVVTEERPKSPWTPSYSVTVQGNITAEEDIEELEGLPPADTSSDVVPALHEEVEAVSGTSSAEQTDEPVANIDLPILSIPQDEPERPKSPWTPSYSVTRQGSMTLDQQSGSEDLPSLDVQWPIVGSETEEAIESQSDVQEASILTEAPSTPPSGSTTPANDNFSDVASAGRDTTPLVSPFVKAAPSLLAQTAPKSIVLSVNGNDIEQPALPDAGNHEVDKGSDVQLDLDSAGRLSEIATEAKKADVVDEVAPEPTQAKSNHVFPSVTVDTDDHEPSIRQPSLSSVLPTLDEDKAANNQALAPLDIPSPGNARARLESTTSSRFFPGGWFSSKSPNDEGRPSLDMASGEFVSSKPSDGVPPVSETEEDRTTKARWCVIM